MKNQAAMARRRVKFVGGTKKRIHFFASRLKYSRFVAVTLVDNERVETLVRCVARDFVAFGGLPLLAVFDRPKTIVTKGGRGREVEQECDLCASDARYRSERRAVP